MNSNSLASYTEHNPIKTLLIALCYFLIYMIYLFLSPESEFWHWVTLVCIPISLLYLLQFRKSGSRNALMTLKEFGLEKSKLWNGVLWAILIGATLAALQLLLSRNKEDILTLFQSGQYLHLLPKAVFIMFITAGFTEEFFFRGFLQTRFQNVFKSNIISIVLTSFAFGFYHLPYAYLNPQWPSYGNLQDAVSLAFSQGVPAGLILGTVYSRTGYNLMASIIVHTMINALPAMLVFKT